MKGRYSGSSMSIYGSILPGAAKIARSAQTSSLSCRAKQRLQWLDWYKSHKKNAELTCRHFGISKKTFYKWKNRFKPYCLSSLESHSRRPKHTRKSENPWQLTDLLKILRTHFPAWSKDKLAVLLKEHPTFSKLELLIKTIENQIEQEKALSLLQVLSKIPREKLFLSPSTLGRIIKKKKFFFFAQNSRRKKNILSSKKASIERKRADKSLKEQAPGSLIQIDTKHLYTPTGKKFFQFTAIDCKTRIKFSRCFSSCSSFSAKLFLQQAIDFFPFPLQSIQTDNGSEYLKYFHQALKGIKEEEIPHYFSYPHCPKENGRVERAIQTDKYEFYLNGNLYHTLELQNKNLDRWNYIYNYLRPHQALEMMTPMEYYESIKDLYKNQNQKNQKVDSNQIPVLIINQTQPLKTFTM